MESSQQDTTPVKGLDAVMSESSRPSTSNVRVWLVDDNDQLRTLVAEMLGQQDGIECVRHFSSPDALLSELASKPGPDVILLDVQMGDRNGLDAVRPIKSLTRSTRVLMFTTCFNPQWRERALNDGASDYLLKSSPLEEVANRIRCRTNDSVRKIFSRRRPNCSVEKTVQNSQPGLIADSSPRLLARTLNRLRSLWN